MFCMAPKDITATVLMSQAFATWLILLRKHGMCYLLLTDCFQPLPSGIRYVVDAGRSKQKLLEDASGGQVARYEVGDGRRGSG